MSRSIHASGGVSALSRRLRWVLLVLLSVPLVGLLGLYVVSELRLRTYESPTAFEAPIPTDSVSLAWGRHLVRTRGCFGCHGQSLEGQVFDEEWPWVKRAVAPNLALHARAYDDQTLADAIRWGVGHDGRALWSMPSYNFRHLADEDLAAVIGFLRSAEAVEQALPTPSLGWSARWRMVTGDERHMADWAAAVPPMVLGEGDADHLVRGEELAMTTCNECHGLDLRGSWQEIGVAQPDLAIVAAYSRDAFDALMRTGTPLDGRDLGLMGVVARDRFAHFTAEEVSDLHSFLQSLPSRPIPEDVFWRPQR